MQSISGKFGAVTMYNAPFAMEFLAAFASATPGKSTSTAPVDSAWELHLTLT